MISGIVTDEMDFTPGVNVYIKGITKGLTLMENLASKLKKEMNCFHI
jgi:hypothetical protein